MYHYYQQSFDFYCFKYFEDFVYKKSFTKELFIILAVEVGEIRPVVVDTAQSGVVDAPCQVTASNPKGQVRELPIQKTPTGYQAQFAPLEEGDHMVAVKYADTEVPKSPYPCKAVPKGPPASKVKAYGPGLEGGVAETPCKFTIDTRKVTQPGGIGVTVEGPAESKIECTDNQDGTCDVTYYPEVPGDYNINVTYADEHIPNSPFTAKVAPSGKIDLSKVKAYGPGLEPGKWISKLSMMNERLLLLFNLFFFLQIK